MNDSRATNRPYWHVDAKWICGIIFAFGLIATLTLFSLNVLTSRSVAVPVATSVLTNLFSRDGVDSTEDLDEIRKQMDRQNVDQIAPFPGQPIVITRQDLNTLPPKQLREKIFSQVAEKYYDSGAQGDQLKNQSGLLQLFSKTTHDQISFLLNLSIAFSLLPLIGLVYFSYGAGRLVSPGLLLFLIALPGTLALIAVKSIFARSTQDLYVSVEAIGLIIKSLLPVYMTVCLAGLALLILAIIVGFWRRISSSKTIG